MAGLTTSCYNACMAGAIRAPRSHRTRHVVSGGPSRLSSTSSQRAVHLSQRSVCRRANQLLRSIHSRAARSHKPKAAKRHQQVFCEYPTGIYDVDVQLNGVDRLEIGPDFARWKGVTVPGPKAAMGIIGGVLRIDIFVPEQESEWAPGKKGLSEQLVLPLNDDGSIKGEGVFQRDGEGPLPVMVSKVAYAEEPAGAGGAVYAVVWHVSDHAEGRWFESPAEAKKVYDELYGGLWAAVLYGPSGEVLERYGAMSASNWSMLDEWRANPLNSMDLDSIPVAVKEEEQQEPPQEPQEPPAQEQPSGEGGEGSYVVSWHVWDHAEGAAFATQDEAIVKYNAMYGGSWATRMYDADGAILAQYGAMMDSDWDMLDEWRASKLGINPPAGAAGDSTDASTPAEDEDKVAAIFKLIDADGNGELSLQEMSAVFWVVNEDPSALIAEAMDDIEAAVGPSMFEKGAGIEALKFIWEQSLEAYWDGIIDKQALEGVLVEMLGGPVDRSMGPGVLEAELARATLERFDADKDGRLSRAERTKFYEVLLPMSAVVTGRGPSVWTGRPLDLNRFRTLMEDTGRDTVDKLYEALTRPKTKYIQAAADDKLEAIFRAFDKNNDGRLSDEELVSLMKATNSPESMASSLGAEVDSMLDGMVDGLMLFGMQMLMAQFDEFVDEKGLSLEGLRLSYAQGDGDVDSDFEKLGLSMPAPAELSQEDTFAPSAADQHMDVILGLGLPVQFEAANGYGVSTLDPISGQPLGSYEQLFNTRADKDSFLLRCLRPGVYAFESVSRPGHYIAVDVTGDVTGDDTYGWAGTTSHAAMLVPGDCDRRELRCVPARNGVPSDVSFEPIVRPGFLLCHCDGRMWFFDGPANSEDIFSQDASWSLLAAADGLVEEEDRWSDRSSDLESAAPRDDFDYGSAAPVVIQLDDGRQLYVEPGGWVGLAREGEFTNTDPERRTWYARFDVMSGTYESELRLRDGRQLYANPSGCVGVASEGRYSNTDVGRRTWRLELTASSESRDGTVDLNDPSSFKYKLHLVDGAPDTAVRTIRIDSEGWAIVSSDSADGDLALWSARLN